MQSFFQKFGKYFLMVVVAALSFASGSTTDIGQALQIALDKEAALAQAAAIINETPKQEIVDAVKSETEDTGAVVSTMENIKTNEPASP